MGYYFCSSAPIRDFPIYNNIMTKRKKILYLITKSNWGGAQRYVFDLASNLDPEQFDVVVALGGRGQLYEELTKAKICTISIESLARDISLVKEFKTTRELWKIITKEQPDVLHINSSKAGGLGALIGRLLGVPKIIFTAHGWAFNEDRPLWQKGIIMTLHSLTILLSHTTIAVSHTTKSQIPFSFLQNRMSVIYNGLTQTELLSREYARSFFLTHIPALRSYPHDFWSVTIAELHPIKQHGVTIEALRHVVTKHPHVRHVLIGDGEERASLEALVQSYKLDSNIFFADHVPNASLYLKAFDLFVLSSRSEALGLVIIEASMAGLPIIASNVGGIPEIITHEKNGILFPQGDSTELAYHYEALMNDEPKRSLLSANAKLRAADFTLEKMIENTTQLYTR